MAYNETLIEQLMEQHKAAVAATGDLLEAISSASSPFRYYCLSDEEQAALEEHARTAYRRLVDVDWEKIRKSRIVCAKIQHGRR